MLSISGPLQGLMANQHAEMSGEEDESDTKCRLARRRKIETSSNVTVSDSHREGKRLEMSELESPSVEKRSPIDSTDPHNVTPTSSASLADFASSSGNGSIAFGSVSLTGRAREMEDAISVQPGFFQFKDRGFPLHFFGVFDGHGGSHVSALCKDMMHSLLSEELMRVFDEPVETEETMLRSAIERCFLRMDQLVLSSCACGRFGEPVCRCDRSGIESEIVGSTAVVAVVGGGRVVVANCGDSRAVLSRGGRTVPLSVDHKPDRADEMARIEAAGGRVIYVNGARVQGILAMSRALGDKYLKPVVISTPEIVISEITPEDECLILASDGLWDVIPNELACNVARRCLAERRSSKAAEKEPNTLPSAGEGPSSHEKVEAAPDAWCSMAAALLARLALGRRSSDNISVIVVDLQRV